jgi:signal transduction histidine kinase
MEEPASSVQRSILVVEDEAIVAQALTRRLSAEGWCVVGMAFTAEQALHLAEEHQPDVVLLDIRLRGNEDGITVAQRLEEPGPAVVFLTAHSDDATLARAKQVQPAGYLLKPFSDAQLKVTLETAYHLHSTRAAMHRAELLRMEAETRLRAVLTYAPDAILAYEGDRLEFHSTSAVDLFGAGDGDTLARHRLSDLLIAKGRPLSTVQAIAEASDLGILEGRRLDGSTFDALATAAWVEGTGLLCLIVRDVTTERQVERQIRESQRLEAVGRITASVAHDFNNVLSLIKGYASLVRAEVADNAVLAEDLDEVLGAVRHGAALARKLLVLSRNERREWVAGINDLVRSVASLLRRALPPTIDLDLELAPELPPVGVEPTALEQVVLNLALNARDAMPEGGVLRIETHAEDAERVSLVVVDTGEGMDEETLSRIFQPFFTTKPVGRGTGLGLTIVNSVLREAGGTLEVESVLGRGTRFTLYLPISDRVLDDTVAPSPLGVPALRDATVLVVDDEAGIRSLIRRTLEPLARRVMLATSGQDAVDLASEVEPDLLVVDLVLPDLGGVVVANHLCRQCPGLPVLLVSGYPDESLLAGAPREWGLLSKPFGPAQLLRAIADLVGEQAEP